MILGRLLTILSLAAPTVAAAGSVQVAVHGVRSSAGSVEVMLCPETSWLKPCPIKARAPARAGTTTVTLKDVPPGRYGAIAAHDRNGNGKTDRNFIGLPTEDVGFSNDAMKRLAKPRFADAAFDHAGDDQRIALTLKPF